MDPAEIELGLARSTARAIAPLCWVLAPLYLVFAISHPLIHPPAVARVMTPIAASTAIALVALGWRVRRADDSFAVGAPLQAVGVAMLVWLNVTVHVWLSAKVHESTNYGLLVIGLGALFYSVRWYALVATLTVASFALAVALLPPSPLGVHFAFLMLSSMSLSLAIFVVRRRAGVRFETMRSREAAQTASLADLSERLQAVLDAMREGVVVIDAEGRVRGAMSRESARVLGDAACEGAELAALLYPDEVTRVERGAFEEWLAAVFEAPASAWEELEALAPDRALLRVSAGETRPIALEFRPMVVGDRVAHVVVRARDESDKHALERAMRAQQEAFAQKLSAMQRLVAGGGQALVAYLRNAEVRLARAVALLERAQPSEADLEEAVEHVHSLKAEADAFELEELRDAAHALEGAIRAAHGRSGAVGALGAVGTIGAVGAVGALSEARGQADRVGAAVLAARELLVRASPVGPAVLAQTTVRSEDVARLHALLSAREDELGLLARRLAARPFGEIVGLLPPAVAKWAARLGKRAQVVVEGPDVLVPPALAQVLGGVLGHLARNSVAHGFELPDARADAGKPAHGELRLACAPFESRGPRGDGVRIVVEDDGAGIDAATEGQIFDRGFTSRHAVDALAGRGVGLSAATAELAAAGYRLGLEPSAVGARFVIEPVALS